MTHILYKSRNGSIKIIISHVVALSNNNVIGVNNAFHGILKEISHILKTIRLIKLSLMGKKDI